MQNSVLNAGNRNEDKEELSPEESENEEDLKKPGKHKETHKTEQIPKKGIVISTTPSPSDDHKDNIDFQDTSIAESAKGDYTGTQTQTIRFDDDDTDTDSEVDGRSRTGSESEDDEDNDKNKPTENSAERRNRPSHSSAGGEKTNRRKVVKRERMSEPTGPKEHDELREKIRLAGMAVVARGKIEGTTSAACTLL